MSSGTFDWCARNDREHDRCSVAYRRQSDRTWVVCSCPAHTPAEVEGITGPPGAPEAPVAPVAPSRGGKPLKVYGASLMASAHMATTSRQPRHVVAARSITAAAELLGVTRRFMAQYGAETHDDVEVAAANSRPGVVFYATDHRETDFRPLTHTTTHRSAS